MPRLIYVLLGTLLLTSGCATVKPIAAPDVEVFDIPPLNVQTVTELGDTVLSKGKSYAYDGIELFNQVSGGDGVYKIKFTIPPQQLIAKGEDDDWTYYLATDSTAYDVARGTWRAPAGLKISKINDNDIEVFAVQSFLTASPEPAPRYKYTKVLAPGQPSFKQELIYNGKVNNSVKFLYRELSNDLMRAPFNQEIQYDLAEDDIIGFKGARIEIIDATNTLLTYRVLRSFPQRQ